MGLLYLYWYTECIFYISYVHAVGVYAQKIRKCIRVRVFTCKVKELQFSSQYLHYIPIWRHFSKTLCYFRTGGAKEHNHTR
jgi:hypothetical protein